MAPSIVFILFSMCAFRMDFSLPLLNMTFSSTNKHQECFTLQRWLTHNLKIASAADVQMIKNSSYGHHMKNNKIQLSIYHDKNINIKAQQAPEMILGLGLGRYTRVHNQNIIHVNCLFVTRGSVRCCYGWANSMQLNILFISICASMNRGQR